MGIVDLVPHNEEQEEVHKAFEFSIKFTNRKIRMEETSYHYQPLQAAALRLSARAAAGARVTSANSYNHREGDLPKEISTRPGHPRSRAPNHR
ncbi:hypothetical protein MRX96_038477 [Rhipicephalus microplus]